MNAWALLCILLSLALGLGSIANYLFIDRQDIERRIDVAALTVLLASGSLASFVLSICFALAGIA
ncbi:MAG: hypothetical protein E5V51_00215 [Mesorhizobium sp.]|nr:hypothetical protein EOA35_01140 [Mesorhizobium sp. M8A.F.Ca.ET.023.01.1.1]TIW90628.1 MAG: hypothetical protein E5V51_00215 [Mesorhizobium sp.]